MNTFGIGVKIGNLPSNTRGFTYVSRKVYYHLILNGNINYETQCQTFIHEIKHIITYIPKVSYYIGINMQRNDFEVETDRVAEAAI